MEYFVGYFLKLWNYQYSEVFFVYFVLVEVVSVLAAVFASLDALDVTPAKYHSNSYRLAVSDIPVVAAGAASAAVDAVVVVAAIVDSSDACADTGISAAQ